MLAVRTIGSGYCRRRALRVAVGATRGSCGRLGPTVRLNRSMGFEDSFRLSVHAVITDTWNRVLLLRATYGDGAWGLPGGALDQARRFTRLSYGSVEKNLAARLMCSI